jgi:tetratricopeptide (TPR) repeat protein
MDSKLVCAARFVRNAFPAFLPFLLLVAVSSGIVASGIVASVDSGGIVYGSQPEDGKLSGGQQPTEDLNDRIARLIQELAHPSYARRVRARIELERMGLRALDAIRDASESSETEIAFSARFLMSSMRIEWAKETDSQAVRDLLREYEDFNDIDRRSAMDRLSNLPDWQGVVPLTRLARYEKNLRLSRHAGLLAMRYDRRLGAPDAVIVRRIREEIGDSQRVVADWLRQFCDDASSQSYDVDAWRVMVAAERELVELSSNASRTDPLTLLDLYRVCATRALKAERRDEALRLALEGLDNVMPRTSDLLDAVGWALDSELYEVVFELRRREAQRFSKEPALIYGLAEAYLLSGDAVRAEETRLTALEVDPLPSINDKESPQVPKKRIEEISMRHQQIARVLENRGLFEWAEGEYRHLVDRLPIDSAESALIRYQLALMLGNLDQHDEVVETLKPLVERLEKDDALKVRMRQGPAINYEELVAKLNYHLGLASDGEQARQALITAQRYDGGDVDTLIAMYRQEGDEKWRTRVETDIKRISDSWLMRIERAEQKYRVNGNDPDIKRDLAAYCNQFAWLAANTNGEPLVALRMSKRAVELFPNDYAYLDTLARCHFSAGDLDQAISYQQMAIGVEPHFPPLNKQLQFFLGQKSSLESNKDSKSTEVGADESDAEQPQVAKPQPDGAGDS